jgi:hypothetical protein
VPDDWGPPKLAESETGMTAEMIKNIVPGMSTTSLPFFEAVRSHDESTLFTVNPEQAKITVDRRFQPEGDKAIFREGADNPRDSCF